MSLALLFPLGLLALAAWAVPLLLHLARREERIATPFAALRWLSIRQKPRQRLRFDEILLLVLRLALIAALALLLARPALLGGDEGDAWELVHPSLAAPAVPVDDGVQRRWLAPGFPALDTAPPSTDVPVSSLLRELDARLPAGATLSVRVPAVFDGADGEVPRLSRRVVWQVVGERSGDTAPAAVADASSEAPPHLAIRHDDAHAPQLRWLRAAATAWHATPEAADARVDGDGTPPAAAGAGGEVTAPVTEGTGVDVAPIGVAPPAGDGVVLAWLADAPLTADARAWVERGGTVLLSAGAPWPLPQAGAAIVDADGTQVAVTATSGRGRVVQLRRKLQPGAWPALIEPDFPRTLRGLVAVVPPAPARTAAATHVPRGGGPGFAVTPREVVDPLLWLVFVLFAVERVVATGRRERGWT